MNIKFKVSCTVTKDLVGFEVFTAVSMKIAVFWVVAPCSLHGATTQKTAIFTNDVFGKKCAFHWITPLQSYFQLNFINLFKPSLSSIYGNISDDIKIFLTNFIIKQMFCNEWQ
jgi:hypothetical protein